MRKAVLVIAFFLVLSLPGLARLYPASVVRIIDGDTIVCDIELGLDVVLVNQYIRLYQVDTPELTGEEKEEGKIARDWLVERVKNGEVEIEIRPEFGNQGKGKYGRWLGILFVSGVNINQELIKEGLAVEYQD